MSTIAASIRQIDARAALPLGRRELCALLLALLIGVLNPSLCILHCQLLQGAGPAHSHTPGQAGHAHHAHHSASSDATGHAGPCAAAGLAGAGRLLPQAAYELAPVASALAALTLALASRALVGPPRLRAALPAAPLTPPPQPLAF